MNDKKRNDLIQLLVEIAEQSRIFVDDVMPQIGVLAIQDYANMNSLCMNLSKLKKKDEEAKKDEQRKSRIF